MRTFALLAAAAIGLAAVGFTPSDAHARLFWQTYGSTEPSPDGCGCAWNQNSDYFVPRYCDSCRYDLFGACKTDNTRSPACKYLHPVNCGYCTPYGPCHYKHRDCVYAKHCGCTPLACTYGKWDLEKCCKHGCGKHGCGKHGCGKHGCGKHGGCGCGGECGRPCGWSVCTAEYSCGRDVPLVASASGAVPCTACRGAGYGEFNELPNVEPFGGEMIGTIQAFPLGMTGARGMGGAMPGVGGGMPGMGGGMMQGPTGPTTSPPLNMVLGGAAAGDSGLTPPNTLGTGN